MVGYSEQGSHEQLELVAEGSKRYRVSSSDIDCFLVLEVLPVRRDGTAGTAVRCRSPVPCQSCVPSVQALRIAGNPQLGEVLTASYTFRGGMEGASIIRWYKSIDGRYWNQVAGTNYPEVSLRVNTELIHQYVRVQVTPIRAGTEESKGTVSVSKLVYINIGPDHDDGCVTALSRGYCEFPDLRLLPSEDGRITSSESVAGTLLVRHDGVFFAPQSKSTPTHELRLHFRLGYPLVFQAPSDPSVVVMCDGRQLLGDSEEEATYRSIVLQYNGSQEAAADAYMELLVVMYRLFFCAASPAVGQAVFGNAGFFDERVMRDELDVKSELQSCFARRRMKCLMAARGDGDDDGETLLERPGSHHTSLALLEEALLASEDLLDPNLQPLRRTLKSSGEHFRVPFLLPESLGVMF